MALDCIIVDDSFFVRETLTEMIQNLNHRVVESFEHGQLLLDSISSLSVDVVFLDVILPDISGLDILKEIRKIQPDIKVVMLSGLSQGITISTALQLGATDFVSKPISKEHLQKILTNFSDDVTPPSGEELSKIGVGSYLLSSFLSELQSHASSTLRDEIKHQSRSILEHAKNVNYDMFIVDLEKITIQPNPDLWGTYSEQDVFDKLSQIPPDLSMELGYLYPDDFMESLFNQAMLTMAARPKIRALFEVVNSNLIGLPDLPSLDDSNLVEPVSASTTVEDLEKQLSISIMDVMGPSIKYHLNSDLLDLNEALKNSIFYSTLVGQDTEQFHEGLFGPLPVSVNSSKELSALVYTAKLKDKTGYENLIILSIYFTPSAEKIVADYNRLSFIIKSQLATLNTIEGLNRSFAKSLLSKVVAFIQE